MPSRKTMETGSVYISEVSDHSDELVLRGGFLPRPEVLTGLRAIDGARFVHIWKVCPTLNKFLTRESSSRRPLSRSSILDELTKAKNEMVDALMGSLRKKLAEEDNNAEDKAAALDLDADWVDSEKPAQKKQNKRAKLTAHQLPLTSVLEFQLPSGLTWKPRVLVEARCAVAVEATQENFQILFDAVTGEIQEGNFKRRRNGSSDSKGDEKEGQSLGGNAPRTYFVSCKKRWIKKVPVQASATKRPYTTKYTSTTLSSSSEDAASGEVGSI